MKYIAWLLLALPLLGIQVFSQTDGSPGERPAVTRGDDVVLEVKFAEGAPLAYQMIGRWAWYAAPARLRDWRPSADHPMVNAVMVEPRSEAGKVKVRVTALIGPHHETEVEIGDYLVQRDAKTAAPELRNFGIVPFEFSLISPPVSMAALPIVVNKTSSVDVTLEPLGSLMPQFKIHLFNSSSKPIRGVAFQTSSGGRPLSSTMRRGEEGATLIEPGSSVEYSMSYPTELRTRSNGDMPGLENNVEFNVTSVVFGDGTYEGNPAAYDQYAGYALGEKIEIKRILSVLSQQYASVEQLLAAASAMPWAVGESDIFGRTPAQIKWVKGAAEATSSHLKKDLVAEISKFPAGAAVPQGWFESSIDRYQKWLDRLSKQRIGVVGPDR